MIRNAAKLEKFNRDILIREQIPFPQALRILEGLHQEARTMGVICAENILEGIDVDIRIAKALYQLR